MLLELFVSGTLLLLLLFELVGLLFGLKPFKPKITPILGLVRFCASATSPGFLKLGIYYLKIQIKRNIKEENKIKS